MPQTVLDFKAMRILTVRVTKALYMIKVLPDPFEDFLLVGAEVLLVPVQQLGDLDGFLLHVNNQGILALKTNTGLYIMATQKYHPPP